MLELLLGMALGAMACTEKGRKMGNQAAAIAMDAAKKVLNNANQKPTEQPAGTSGNDNPDSGTVPEPVECLLQRPTRKEPGGV